MSENKKRFCLVLVVGFFLLGSAQGVASDASKGFIKKGYSLLTQKKFEAALGQFQSAFKADPKNGEALFFQAVAFNRIGKAKEAAHSLDQAKKLGYQHPEWSFEKGWAHLGLKEWKEALHLLKEFDKKSPGRGQTSEFIGRAYFGMGDYTQAKKYLEKAVRETPNLKKTADFYLAAIPEEKGSKEEKGEKPWELNLSVGGAYNSNAISLGNGVTRPTDISRQNSFLSSPVLGGSYRFDFSDKNQLTFGHQFFSSLNEVSESLNVMDNLTSLYFKHTFGSKVAFGAGVSNEFTHVQTSKFREQIVFQPVLGWRLADWLVSEATYGFTYANYFFASNANQNRDAKSNSAGLNHYLSIPKTDWHFRLGYSHLWNLADGPDFDYEGNTINAAVSHPLLWKTTGDLFFSQIWNRYSNVNSLSATLFRGDNISNVVFRINTPIAGRLKGYLQAGYTRSGSNIATFNYRSHQGGLGFQLGI